MSNRNKLYLIKSIHTAVWLFFVSVIFHVLWSGITGFISVCTWIAIALVLVEGLTLALFHGKCPLTVIARRYSNSNKHNFDIFLPEWLAHYNKLIFTILYLVGVILVIAKST